MKPAPDCEIIVGPQVQKFCKDLAWTQRYEYIFTCTPCVFVVCHNINVFLLGF